MKFFNTAGPVNPADHYYVPHRFNEPEIRQLIEQKKYFILHAPRQSGKTTGLLQLVKLFNSGGQYNALYVNFEGAQAARSNYLKGMATILEQFFTRIKDQLPNEQHIIAYLSQLLQQQNFTGSSLNSMLNEWAKHSAKPLIIFIDEIDSLIGDTLISVLRQLRSGYDQRPTGFPQSLCLVGVRDVRDYRIYSDEQQAIVLGGSAFNIKAKSLTLPAFTHAQVKDLYEQHTAETGQKFTEEAIDYAFEQTQGQPWLVNALAYEACFEMITDRSQTVTKAILEQAKEILIKRQDTHLDVLIDRLNEPRVYKIIDAIINGQSEKRFFPDDDVLYCRDLGLIKKDKYEIANPIYQDIFPRALTASLQNQIDITELSYKNPDGSINGARLIEEFQQFFRENSVSLLENFNYLESGPHLVMMAYLQRVVNGGGTIHREYALGRKRVDLLVKYHDQRIVIELKVRHSPDDVTKGLVQTAEYMDICNATEGHLILFDQRPGRSWDEKIYHRQEICNGKTITVWGA